MHQQRGMSMISLLLVIALAALLLKALISLVPMYWEHKMISTVVNNMHSTLEVRNESRPNQMKRILEDRLASNDIRVDMSGLKFRAVSQRGLEMEWDYELRRNWIGNIDLVVRFSQYKDFSQ